jgi:hypothetical protein
VVEDGERLAEHKRRRLATLHLRIVPSGTLTTESDPTEPIRNRAAAFPGVAAGTSCNQGSFKVGKRAFLYIGPGAKGQGFKAMFKLDESMPDARELAVSQPTRFEVGSTGWVTSRFTAEEPLEAEVWKKWLDESYTLAGGSLG